jgi:hypothetical protein
MEAGGMLIVCRFLPYVPGVLLPQGTVGKAHAEDDRRRITDAGAPRSPLIARDGTRLVSVNDGVRMPLEDGQPCSPLESKPGVGVNVNDNSILAYLGEAMRKDGFAPHEYQTFLACDDIKAFFNQFTLHPSERSRFCLTFLRESDLYVAAELVLGFGCAPSSGIAQRFAHLVRQIVSERMAAKDAPFMADLRRWAWPHVRVWFAHRGALTAETGIERALLFFININTDESLKSAVACARMLRFLCNWTWTCLELSILCVAAHKRGLSTYIWSLGVILCHTLRGVFILVAKVISASADLTGIHAGELTPFFKCHKVFGLTCHFCDALCLPRATSYGMYADFR